MNLVPLYEEAIQFNNFNGTVLAAGKVEVWYLGRTRKADIYADVAGETPLPNPFDLNDLGMQEVYVNPAFNYTLVVYDPYGAELFSVDKYLQGAGGHTTSNVVVQPSENIGVSAWTVGEVQIYQPYLVGEVGKTYEGILPIVVNNDVNRISAQHIPLGVQDPLYFVEDSETACIIGCSAQTEIPTELSGKWDEASDAVIANSAQWAEGTEYEAGSYIDIDGHTINVTGLQPEGDYAYNSALSSKLDVTALPQDLVHSGDLTAYYPSDNPSGFITGVDLTDYATTAQLDEKLDKTDSGNFYPMEGNPSGFLTAHQSLEGYATEQWVEDKGYLTAVDIQESAGWNEATTVVNNNSAIWNNTTNIVSSNSAQWGASNPQIPVTGINGIKISESGDKVVFEVSADYALTDDLTGKQDSLTFGYKDTAISSIDNSALYDNSAHARITTLAGRISDLSSNKLDSSAFSDVSGTFLTAVDLTPYQTTAGMTAYQSAGDYLTTADSANFYTTANESGFITGVDLSDYALSADVSNELSNKLDTTAFSDVSGSFLTAVDIPQSATWNEVSTTVQSNSAQWAEGGAAGVSGTNVVFVPQYEGADYGNYYSAIISGDVVVTTGYYFGEDIYPGTTGFSLSSVGASIGNKLDKDKIEASNTIKIINNHAEVTDKAYRQTGFIDIAAHSVDARGSTVNVTFVSHDADNDSYLYSAIVTVETTASGSYIPAGWSLVSYENNSAIFTKYYSLSERTDTFYLATYYGDWGDFTNAEGSATVYSALEIAPLAFKDEIPSTANFYTNDNPSGFITGVPAGTMNESAFAYDASNNITAYNGSAFKAGDEFPQSATEAIETVTSSSAIWNETTDTVSSNSGAWGGSALPISAGPGIKFEMVDNTLIASVDETELLASTATSAFTLTEPFSSFEQVKIKLRWWDKVPDNYYNVERFTNNKCSLSWTYFDNITDGGPLELAGASWTSNNGIDYNLEGGFARTFGITSTGMSVFTHEAYPISIVGINRIAGGN